MILNKTNNENSKDTIDSIVHWLKGMAVSFILAILSLVLVGYITVTRFNDQRDRDNQQDLTQLNIRLVESCHNYNRDQSHDREAAHRKLFALAEVAGRPIDENNISPELASRIATYDAEMANFYTYRKCDLACAKAFVDNTIPDCGISNNEEGT